MFSRLGALLGRSSSAPSAPPPVDPAVAHLDLATKSFKAGDYTSACHQYYLSSQYFLLVENFSSCLGALENSLRAELKRQKKIQGKLQKKKSHKKSNSGENINQAKEASEDFPCYGMEFSRCRLVDSSAAPPPSASFNDFLLSNSFSCPDMIHYPFLPPFPLLTVISPGAEFSLSLFLDFSSLAFSLGLEEIHQATKNEEFFRAIRAFHLAASCLKLLPNSPNPSLFPHFLCRSSAFYCFGSSALASLSSDWNMEFLARARQSMEIAVELEENERNCSRLVSELISSTGLSEAPAGIIASFLGPPPVPAVLLQCSLIDLIILSRLENFPDRVASTPPSLKRLSSLSPEFAASDEIRLARQLFGLLHLSRSIPRSQVGAPAAALIASIWVSEVNREFSQLLRRYFLADELRPAHRRLDENSLKLIQIVQQEIKHSFR